MFSLRPGQARAALLGLLVGDAVGVPYEFKRRDEVPDREFIEMTPPSGFRPTRPGAPRGTWSDDGAMTLALLDSLQRDASLCEPDVASRLLAWFRKGKYAADDIVFDCGVTVRAGLLAFERGTAAHLCGGARESDNGNGALVRSLACLLVPFESDAVLVDRAMRQGRCTHRHLRSQVVCALYVLTAARVALRAEGLPEAIKGAAGYLDAVLDWGARAELGLVMSKQLDEHRGSGYVVDSFWSAMGCVGATQSFKACIQASVGLGNDTDSTACVAGGVAGLLYGEECIPEDWLSGLRGRDRAMGLLSMGQWV
ncbi:ADP-ribosylglycohydrolase family protein [Ottowia sp.]|uniref:ADP-ribosylglycohydrolase family protein n=1 Tax=Ottowia sp. TaxID=1898956 RepID=UPI0025DBCFF1|nr:ADP-ribosylglycohydrolase family protein [Ottowia sp.]